MTPEVAYSIATGRAFAPFAEIHEAAEKLLDRPIFTHEFASTALWDLIRKKFEEQAIEKFEMTQT